MLESWLIAPHSTNNMLPRENYEESSHDNNETFEHSEACKRLRAPSHGEALLAKQFLQETTKRPVLSAGYAIPNWAKISLTRRDRSVAGEPRAISDRAMWEEAAIHEHAEKEHCVQ
eukprot:200966-Pyramimonas_sp.AAC.1